MSDMFASKHLGIFWINIDDLHGFISCGAEDEVQRKTEKYTNTLSKEHEQKEMSKSGKKTAKHGERKKHTLNSI